MKRGVCRVEETMGNNVISREMPNVEELSAIVVDCAYKLHVEAGPGSLESVYEVVLEKMPEERGLEVKRQVPVSIRLLGLKFDEGFRADLIVNELLLVELKSVEHLAPVHAKQVLTYLRLLGLPLALLINFGAPTFKEGVKRIANNHQNFAPSREPGCFRLARSREVAKEGDMKFRACVRIRPRRDRGDWGRREL
ncbi:MAG TPA: GxxExxY protein [Candidatus Limnocylindria bacterium]|jgi:iron complex transport system substrate-binding protein|nr:GxxExxY protein [Candidatus Limnocylindria bacterium]